jgi:DNA-binding HxlR family transcriptional regulator
MRNRKPAADGNKMTISTKTKPTNPLEQMLRKISGPWTMYILWVLDNHGTMRFGELARQVEGISPKVLTDRLRLLEEIGIIDRHYEPTIPPQVSYELTDRGKELTKPLYDLCHLVNRWNEEDLAS